MNAHNLKTQMVKEEMLFFWNALPRNFKAIISFLVALLVPLLLTLLFSKTTLKDKWLIILIVLLAIFIYLSIYFYQKYRFVYKYSEYLQNQNLSVLFRNLLSLYEFITFQINMYLPAKRIKNKSFKVIEIFRKEGKFCLRVAGSSKEKIVKDDIFEISCKNNFAGYVKMIEVTDCYSIGEIFNDQCAFKEYCEVYLVLYSSFVPENTSVHPTFSSSKITLKDMKKVKQLTGNLIKIFSKGGINNEIYSW